MAFQCNIDRNGRIGRAMLGALCLASGIALVWIRPIGPPWLSVVVGLGVCAGGGFAIFEAVKGWCALRAVGIRLPF